jgi:hypothetical protein
LTGESLANDLFIPFRCVRLFVGEPVFENVGPRGHGGAFSTNMSVDRERGLVLVFLVQHAGFPGDGGKSKDAFTRAALEKYGKAKRGT